MFNPVYPFTLEVLHATVQRGCHYFVRNHWPNAFDHINDQVKGTFIITHYNDKLKALAHFNSFSNDRYSFLYDWNEPDQQEKLTIAASHPAGYKVYSAYFLDDYKKRITNAVKEKINRYVRLHTQWKPSKGETVAIDFFLQFGTLFITMSYSGQQIKVKFEDIEKER